MPFGSQKYMQSSPGNCGIGPIYSMLCDFSRASTSRSRLAVATKAQCCMAPMPLRLPAGLLRFGISKKARGLSYRYYVASATTGNLEAEGTRAV